MRYILVSPSTSISGTPYVAFKGNVPIGKSLQKATSKMSYYGISTNIANSNNIIPLLRLAKKMEVAPPAETTELEEPKEQTKNE